MSARYSFMSQIPEYKPFMDQVEQAKNNAMNQSIRHNAALHAMDLAQMRADTLNDISLRNSATKIAATNSIVQGRENVAAIGAQSKNQAAQLDNFSATADQLEQQAVQAPDAKTMKDLLDRAALLRQRAQSIAQPKPSIAGALAGAQAGQGTSSTTATPTVQTTAPAKGGDKNTQYPLVKSKADYEALPAGAVFVDSTGKRYTKPSGAAAPAQSSATIIAPPTLAPDENAGTNNQ
jgi:hypothetical protein